MATNRSQENTATSLHRASQKKHYRYFEKNPVASASGEYNGVRVQDNYRTSAGVVPPLNSTRPENAAFQVHIPGAESRKIGEHTQPANSVQRAQSVDTATFSRASVAPYAER